MAPIAWVISNNDMCAIQAIQLRLEKAATCEEVADLARSLAQILDLARPFHGDSQK